MSFAKIATKLINHTIILLKIFHVNVGIFHGWLGSAEMLVDAL